MTPITYQIHTTNEISESKSAFSQIVFRTSRQVKYWLTEVSSGFTQLQITVSALRITPVKSLTLNYHLTSWINFLNPLFTVNSKLLRVTTQKTNRRLHGSHLNTPLNQSVLLSSRRDFFTLHISIPRIHFRDRHLINLTISLFLAGSRATGSLETRLGVSIHLSLLYLSTLSLS